MINVVNLIIEQIYPRRCYSCGRLGVYLCRGCLLNSGCLSYQNNCHICRLPADGFGIHVDCLQYTWLDGFAYLGSYTGVLAKMIWDAKYGFQFNLIPYLSCKLACKVVEVWGEKYFDYIIFIPTYSFRYRWRGYNQSALTAKCISSILGIPMIDILGRRGGFKNISQVGLKREERFLNVRDKFFVKCPTPKGKYLIIDDVFTTGATIKELANLLKLEKGVEVHAAVLAVD